MSMDFVAAPGVFRAAARNTWRGAVLAASLAACAAALAQTSPAPQTKSAGSAEVPVLKAGAGPCTAEFSVRDADGKAVYNAKIRLQAEYGFLGMRKLDLNIGTNYEGQARIEGLPEKIRGGADFKISEGGREKSVAFDPIHDCSAQHAITLEAGSENKTN
jgi:hypothetical protein